MNEATIVTELKTKVLNGTSAFESGSVVFNVWDVLNWEYGKAPYLIIETSDIYNVQLTSSFAGYQHTLGSVVNIIVYFSDWTQAYSEISNVRNELINALTTDNVFSDGSVIEEVRADSPILELYDKPSISEDQDATPIFLAQRLIVNVLGT